MAGVLGIDADDDVPLGLLFKLFVAESKKTKNWNESIDKISNENYYSKSEKKMSYQALDADDRV